MKQKLKTIILTLALISAGSLGGVFAPSVVHAESGVDIGGNNSSDEDTADTTSFSFAGCGKDDVGIECLVSSILSFLSVAVGIAVVAGITVGGIMYSMARGNPGNAQKGIKIITNAVIGLLLYLLMFAIINFLVPGGVFS